MNDYNTLFKDYPDVVTVREMKEMLRIGNNQAYNLITSGKIPSYKIGTKGRTRYIPKQCVIDYLNQQLNYAKLFTNNNHCDIIDHAAGDYEGGITND